MPRNLVFTTQPSSILPGGTISPAPELELRRDGVLEVADADVSIALANNPSGAALGGTLTQRMTGGRVSFPGLSLDKLGSGYTLRASLDDTQLPVLPLRPTKWTISGSWIESRVLPVAGDWVTVDAGGYRWRAKVAAVTGASGATGTVTLDETASHSAAVVPPQTSLGAFLLANSPASFGLMQNSAHSDADPTENVMNAITSVVAADAPGLDDTGALMLYRFNDTAGATVAKAAAGGVDYTINTTAYTLTGTSLRRTVTSGSTGSTANVAGVPGLNTTLHGEFHCHMLVKLVNPAGSDSRTLYFRNGAAGAVVFGVNMSNSTNNALIQPLWSDSGGTSAVRDSGRSMSRGVWHLVSVARVSAGGANFVTRTWLDGALLGDGTSATVTASVVDSMAFFYDGFGGDAGSEMSEMALYSGVPTTAFVLEQARRCGVAA